MVFFFQSSEDLTLSPVGFPELLISKQFLNDQINNDNNKLN